MSSEHNAARRAALETLRFKKRAKDAASSQSSGASSSASFVSPQPVHNPLPQQSRDATLRTSHYFSHPPTTPASDGRVLVPSSSPLRPEPSYHNGYQHNNVATASSLMPNNSYSQTFPYGYDPLTAPSGYTSGPTSAHASFSRPSVQNGFHTPPIDIPGRGEPPRKRIRGPSESPPDPLDLFRITNSPATPHRMPLPGSPELQRPGQRRKLNTNLVVSSASDDESMSEAVPTLAGPSKPRIVRGDLHKPEPISSEPSQSDVDEEKFRTWKMTQPLRSMGEARAAWKQAGGVSTRADAILSDPTWRPPSTLPPKPAETGRVKEVEEANKAVRAKMREMGKKSSIYQTRPVLDGKPLSKAGLPITTPPVSKSAPIDVAESPGSPEIMMKKGRRLKRKVVDSSEDESEPEIIEVRESRSTPVVAHHSKRTLDYFNTATAEGLQELSGCTVGQANKVIELRPYATFKDLNEKLGQGRKKAGPGGISSRMVEDCETIFASYAAIDNILAKCESIGSKLKKEINTWTTDTPTAKPSNDKSTATSRGTSVASDLVDDGALTLRSQASLAKKPSYYISKQPKSLAETLQLKEYQLVGINWLNLLYRSEYSCILADEMGLGKTVQVISFLAHLQQRGSKGPHLVVVPSSTLENWVREFTRFAPNISIQTYYAGKEERPALRQTLRDTQRASGVEDGWEVLLTTYNLAQGDEYDRKFFKRIDWNVSVFDEGHVLKNFQSQRYRALLSYGSRWRLLLTGTPLQNNLQELVSLLNFILPEVIGPQLDPIRAVFKAKGDSKVTLLAQERVSRAKKMLTPFVLRRRKDQVLKDLPKKRERIEWCEMTTMQKSIYNDALRRSRKTIFDLEGNEAEAPVSNTRGKQTKKKTRATARNKDKLYLENSANVLMDLRKAALHPMLFRRRFTDEILTALAKLLLKEPEYRQRGAVFEYVKEDMEVMTDAELQVFCKTFKSTRKYMQQDDCYEQAGKVQVLLELLESYQKDNRRVLIFSQFTQVLDILQRVLEQRKIKFLLLTGSTAVDVRQALVDQFTDDESIPVFLLSTKAGGMGINLTAASVVIMFDQDFNPHNDKQAQDRAYRIGQKREVEVVKLITKGSIEEDMLQLGMTKLALDEAVAGEENGEQVEKEMKTTLMSAVRKKLEEVKEEDEDDEVVEVPAPGETAGASTAASTKEEVGSPLTDAPSSPEVEIVEDKMETDEDES
ncbi:SNF2 family N-terminal domain-containing protein [Cristinia sonorae]|uniref:DNA helicase n=1 Tax=Cristinia sonorae TaxID=1940300 RepID=A0A8K0XKS0_9AGAR|nr:SNF2 family N-terminal domain-containing protein [Cristinia sonorae]